MSGPIYLDYQATTPLAPEVAAAMRPWLETGFGNPHSPHRLGREAAAAVEVAREQVLEALITPLPASEEPSRHCGRREAIQPAREAKSGDGLPRGSPPRHDGGIPAPERNPPLAPPLPGAGSLYFTSGATEALNWALKGAAARLPADRRRIVTLATEHAAVLDTVEWLGTQGYEIDILPVGGDGLVDLDLAAARIHGGTGLVAAMLVNNEIGVIQPIADIAAIARRHGALFLCDAVQGFGRVPLPLGSCDMVALSAHKVHGPKGIGALWLRDGVAVDPLLHGGGQEGGLRSGTLSPALCVGFGEAARLLVERAEEDHAHVGRLWHIAREILWPWTLNGSDDRRYRGNLNLRRDGVDAARLISEIRAVAFSSGSACASGSGRSSHVLAALGLGGREARSSIRLGFGRYTSEKQLTDALTVIAGRALLQLDGAA